jgi:hypothetical protein
MVIYHHDSNARKTSAGGRGGVLGGDGQKCAVVSFDPAGMLRQGCYGRIAQRSQPHLHRNVPCRHSPHIDATNICVKLKSARRYRVNEEAKLYDIAGRYVALAVK